MVVSTFYSFLTGEVDIKVYNARVVSVYRGQPF